ncbi:hypothetical protein diail_5844 [Diaporthe ilicicola]|nr:hypothetical protein diail_5844 [Diaporthe ilicicola]
MKCTPLAAVVATLLSRAVLSAPVPASIQVKVDAAARDEFSTAGRSGYNSVDTTARDATTAAEADGRSGYNSVDVVSSDSSSGFETDGRSGYNSIEVTERDNTADAGTDGRSGYN